MINLIPPDAQKLIITEYWFRVVAVWILLAAITALLIAIMLLPTYVLVTGQVRAYAETAAESLQDQASQSDESANLSKVAVQAKTIIFNGQVPSLVAVYDAIVSVTDTKVIAVTSYNVLREGTSIGEVKVEGEAATRKDLIAFRDRLTAHPKIEKIDLPISNLTKDKEIQFSLNVVMSSTTPAL